MSIRRIPADTLETTTIRRDTPEADGLLDVLNEAFSTENGGPWSLILTPKNGTGDTIFIEDLTPDDMHLTPAAIVHKYIGPSADLNQWDMMIGTPVDMESDSDSA